MVVGLCAPVQVIIYVGQPGQVTEVLACYFNFAQVLQMVFLGKNV